MFRQPVQQLEVRRIKASATYERIGDLAFSTSAQARDVDLVRKVRTNPISRLFQPTKELFVRKTYQFNANESASATVRKYLWSEYKILSTLRHPNIVQYADFEYKQRRNRGSASIYMEYCKGGDLSQYVSRHGVPGKIISEKQFWEIFYQLASALVYCHTGVRVDVNGGATVDSSWKRPVLHRDIKPANGMQSRLEWVAP
jgi:serine/threonine protein kinase